MIELLKRFEEQAPEIVFEWKDAPTGAEGWIVINSLRGGAAGGGTRMRKGLDKNEVLSLAKTMEIKFTIAGPPIGGAKSGINFDPADPRKEEVLERWYKAVMPILKAYYGTGGDLNVDEIKEVIPITRQYGLLHPQEGVLIGHFNPSPEDEEAIIGQLNTGVTKVIEDSKYSPDVNRYHTVADMITGWGVSEAVRHYYDIWYGKNMEGKRAIIQGWGNVASAAAWFLSQAGVKIVGIIDHKGGLINDGGFDFEDITNLYNNKVNNKLFSKDMLPFDTMNRLIWGMEADIFIPAAASRLITKEQLKNIKEVEVISCGANVPFADTEIFYGPISEYADNNFAVLPDFIANCGMARTFAYLMEKGNPMTDEAIFGDVSNTIRKALEELHSLNSSRNLLMETAYGMVLKKIMRIK